MASRGQTRVAVVLRDTDTAERLEGAAALAARVGVPVTLAIDAETAMDVARARPAQLAGLRAAFAAGRLRALLTTAHGADPAVLTAEELADELRLDEETLQLVFGATVTRRGFGRVADAVMLAELTPPWLGRGVVPTPEPPAALVALAKLSGWCVDAFGLRRVPGVAAAALVDEGWNLDRFPARARLPLVRRRGLVAARRAWLAAYQLCDVLSVEARVPGLAAHATEALSATVLPMLRALAAAHGAGDAMARAEAAYEDLRGFRFLGAQRWRALLTALRDAFALLAARRSVDWSMTAETRSAQRPVLRLVEPTAPLN